MTAPARVDLLVDLLAADVSSEPLHHGLEELDRAGFVPHRFGALPERALARVDRDLVGTAGARLHGASAWVIERKNADAAAFVCGETAATPPVATADDDAPIVGVAGYDGRDRAATAARFDAGTADVGPIDLAAPLAAHRLTIMRGVFFSLRERGFARAYVRDVAAGALPHLRAAFGEAVAIVEAAPRARPRTLILASGGGSNFQAVAEAARAGELALDVAGLLVNRAGSGARGRAEALEAPVREVVWARAEEDRAAYDARVLDAARAFAPDLVLLLGWMHLLPAAFVAAFPRMFNLHPAYLPLDPEADTVVLPDGSTQGAFRGADAVGDARRAGARWIGAAVHRVTPAMDRGEILARVPIAFDPEAPPEGEARRLHAFEHRLLRAALRDAP